MRIFGKQLLLHLSILAISFAFLGIVLTRAMADYMTAQREAALQDSANRVARSVESFFLTVYFYGDVNFDPLAAQIENVSDLLDARVTIVNSYLDVIYSGLPHGATIATSYFEDVFMGDSVTFSTSTVYGSADELLFAAHPFRLGSRVIGAVLVSVSLQELEATISGMHRITLLSLLGAAILSAILVYISSRAMTRRLRQMNDAAGIISGGVFENRIPVKSHDEVGQLAIQFNTMAESLHNQELIRRAFISNLSHDLRSPLTSIAGFMKAIKDGTAPPESHGYYQDIVLSETERLIKLSNDILDIHRIQDAKLELDLSVFDINKLIRDTIMGLEQRANEQQITITSHFAHATDMVHADKDKIQRCLYNLLDNAIKFTPQGDEIIVETTIKGKKVAVSVKDNGPGMTPDEQRHIFDRFFKGDPSRNELQGSGLGLSIAKEFILAHGEQIAVLSAPGKGSRFTFYLLSVGEV